MKDVLYKFLVFFNIRGDEKVYPRFDQVFRREINFKNIKSLSDVRELEKHIEVETNKRAEVDGYSDPVVHDRGITIINIIPLPILP